MSGGDVKLESSILYRLREFFLCCGLLPAGAFDVGTLGALPPAYALLGGQEAEAARYLDGEALYTFDFLFASRETLTAAGGDALGSCAFYDALARWMAAQSRARFLPYLTGGRIPLSLAARGAAAVRPSGEDRAEWSLPCRLTYLWSPEGGIL